LERRQGEAPQPGGAAAPTEEHDGRRAEGPEWFGPLFIFRERIFITAQPPEVTEWVSEHGVPNIPEEPVWEEGTLSDLNLQLWTEYFHYDPQGAADLLRRRPDIYIRSHAPYEADDREQNPTGLSQRPCTEPGCPRCALGRGGYRFCWVSSRWTAHMARGVTWNRWGATHIVPNHRRQLSWHAGWPLGLGIGPGDPFAAQWQARSRGQ
jgi:hypothetical protein